MPSMVTAILIDIIQHVPLKKIKPRNRVCVFSYRHKGVGMGKHKLENTEGHTNQTVSVYFRI